ncbi:MAG: hypothetical protein AAF563_02665 [Pseudomonadota bacterium]
MATESVDHVKFVIEDNDLIVVFIRDKEALTGGECHVGYLIECYEGRAVEKKRGLIHERAINVVPQNSILLSVGNKNVPGAIDIDAPGAAELTLIIPRLAVVRYRVFG